MGPKRKTPSPVALDDSLLEMVSGGETGEIIYGPVDNTPEDVQDEYEGVATGAIEVD